MEIDITPPFPPTEDDELTNAAFDKDGRLVVPSELMAAIGWKRAAGDEATYELVDDGRIRVWPGETYAEAFTKAEGDEEIIAALKRLLRRGGWLSARRLKALPTSVRVHVMETGEVNGLVFVRALANCLEIVGNQRRLRDIAADRQTAKACLPAIKS